MKSFASAAVLLASANSVLGHAVWQQLWVDGVDQAGTCVRLPGSNSPVTDPTSQDLACNAGGSTGVAGMCAVTAGQKVTVEMHQHQSRDCAQEAIGGSHHGPVIVYMAAVTDATTADPNAAKWFKVAEEGYDVATKVWADTTLNDNCGKKDFTVPVDLATGDYLVRAEIIALHTAGSAGGAQFYMSCYQIHVEGTGSASPAGVSFPGAYSATDPGIFINIYATIDEYVIPGPELYGAAGAAPAAPAAPATPAASTAAPAASSTVVRAAASSKAPSASASKSTAAPVAIPTAPVAADPADECE
ncbi:glycosyl hydrolase family 61 [Diplocarpon rosae]|nr:glycosyl hydrolase family 61 [Diplocarpon rosae]